MIRQQHCGASGFLSQGTWTYLRGACSSASSCLDCEDLPPLSSLTAAILSSTSCCFCIHSSAKVKRRTTSWWPFWVCTLSMRLGGPPQATVLPRVPDKLVLFGSHCAAPSFETQISLSFTLTSLSSFLSFNSFRTRFIVGARATFEISFSSAT